MRFKDKVVLVTGGNSGIGRGIVHAALAEGAIVPFVGRDPAKGARVEAEIAEKGGEGAFFQTELADEQAAKGMIGEVVARYGKLDVVVNNAGVGGRRAGVDDKDQPGVRWSKLRGPNLDAPYFVSAYALPHLAKTKGSMVNTSSTATWHGNWGLYGIAKAGVEGLTRSFAAEGAPMGVRVNGVSPGWIATENDAAEPPSGSADGAWAMPPSAMNRMGTPAEIAAAVLFLASEEASFITGQTLIVDGGLMILDYPSMPLLEDVAKDAYSQPV
jgi:NAD(P)-dependent dehydrogenase (short-subunit alcohol dehydrogenase family)